MRNRLFAFFIAFVFVWASFFAGLPPALAEGEITLAIAKSVDKTDVAPGEVFTYTLDYAISGTGEVANATIVDLLPEGLEYVSSIKTVHITTVDTANVGGRDQVTFTFQTPCATGVSGKLRISARFKNGTTQDGATATNCATFRADTMADVVSNDVVVTAHIVVPNWSVSKAQTVPSGQAVGGNLVTYRVRVNGNASGSLNLTDVRIVDSLPADATFVSATGGGVYDSGTHRVSWTIASIGVGSTADRSVTVTYPEGQTEDAINNVTVTAKFYGSETEQPDKTDSCTTTFGVAAPGMGNLVKTNRQVQEEYHPGQTSRYGLGGVSNNGNVPLDNLMLEDAMPAEIDLTAITTGTFNTDLPMSVYYTLDTSEPYAWVKWVETTTTANQTLNVSALGLPEGTHITRVQWRMGTVPAGFGQSGIINVYGRIRADAVGVVTNNAWLTSTYSGEAQPARHSSVTFDIVGAYPWLAPAKALVGASTRDFGEAVSWTLTVKNHDYATGQLVNPMAIDVLPPNLNYVSYTVNSTPAGVTVGAPEVVDKTIGGQACKLVRWPITGTLEPGETVQITLNTAIADQTPVGWLTNKFYLTTNDPGTASMKGATVDDTDDLDNDGATDDRLAEAQAQVFVKFQGALTTATWVKGELDAGWTQYAPGNYGQTLPGGLANYRFTIKNDGSNGPISNIVAIDTLPRVGDRLIIGGAARGTAWQPYLVDNITGPNGAALPAELKIYYTTNPNPSMAELVDPVDGANAGDGWSLTPPADITAVSALKFEFNGYTLNPGDQLTFEWPMRAPLGAPAGQIAWDSMAVGATCEGEGGPEAFLPTESSKVGFIINDHIPYFGVGDHVWVDTNGNGLQDGGEPGVNDILVNLYHGSAPNTVINYTRTGDNQSGSAGYWSFPSLIADGAHQYIIEYVFPESYRATLYNADGQAGVDDTDTDSDVDTATHSGGVREGRITFTSPATASDRMNYDLGIWLPASLSGLVWNDLDHDGVQDAGEAKLTGVTVSLTDQPGNPVTDADGAAVNAVTTDGNGAYSFPNLKPGAYKVTVTNPDGANYVFTTANAGGNDTVDSDTDTNGAVLLSLTSGQNMTNVDSGLHKAILGDRVWLDADADGVQDAGETTGVNAVTVTLKSGGTTVATTTTNSSGSYVFRDLDAGDYTVELTVPGGYYLTTMDAGSATDSTDSDFNPATAATAPVTLSAGEVDNTVDGGLFQPAQVGNLVWNDRNHDGLQTGESGIAGVTVALTDQSGNPVNNVLGIPVAATVTNGSGNYSFINLRPGNYRITVTNPDPANYVFSTANVGGNDSIDSDVGVATGFFDFTLASNANNQTVDAGLHKAILGDRVWHDTDADGVQDGGETGISGVTVTLKSGGSTVATTITNGSGIYTFQDLNAGDYTVVVTLPSIRYVTSKDSSGNDATDSDFNPPSAGETSSDSIALAVGAQNTSVDCGLFLPATIGNFVWNDQNRDGVQDAGEPGLDGVTVSLLTTAGAAVTDVDGNPIDPVTTAGGAFSFSGVRPGPYKLHFTLLPEFIFTSALQGADPAKDSNVVPATGDVANFTVVSNTTYNNYDAGMYKAALGDLVWEDVDADGIQDGGEPGIPGVTVELVRDDGNGVIGAEDTVVATRITDASGRYSFVELDSGRYFIHVTIPAQYYATSRNAGDDNTDSDIDQTGSTAIIDLIAGQADSSFDAGLFRAAAAGDFAWEDLDADGVQDLGEPGIPGVTVIIRDGAGNPVTNVTGDALDEFITDISGRYQIPGLTPGTYRLQFELPDGYQYAATTGPAATGSDAVAPGGWTANFTLTSNQTKNDIDGGFYRPASLSGLVWKDRDNDGIQDAGELGVTGITVELRDGSNALVATAATDENGSYSFPSLVPGAYRVVVLQPNPQLFFSARNQGGDDTRDSDVDTATGMGPGVTLVSGQEETHMDAGIQACADIAVTKASDKALYDLGETVVFTITAKNLGADNATGLVLADLLPAGVDYVSYNGNGDYAPATGLWTIGALAAGDTVTLHITATCERTGNITNTATVSTLNEYDAFPANDRDDAHISVGVSADLILTKTVDESKPWLNDTVVFTVSVTNNGPDGATNVVVADPLPAGLAYVSDDSGGKYRSASGDWSVGSLASGATATIHISAKATALGVTVNTATASADEYDRNPVNNVDGCSVTPKARADLAISKAASVAVYNAGDVVDFTLTVKNLGPDDATGVVVNDRLPDNVVFGSAEGDGSYDAETGLWEIGNLTVGETVTLVIRTTAGTHGGIVNTATVQGSEPDPDESNNSATATVEPVTASLGDLVWLDYNGNGLQDRDEAGVAGVTLELLEAESGAVQKIAGPHTNAAGDVLDSTVTDENGNWQFAGLASGWYQIRVTPPEGYILTTANAGDDDTIDSNSYASGITDVFLLKAGGTDVTVDFGVYLPNRIDCRVWYDTDRDGVYDGSEKPLPGVTVELYRNGVLWGMTVTDSTGRYSFDGLPAGDYTLRFTPPEGLDFTENDDINIIDGTTGTITLGAGETVSVDSGYAGLVGPDTATADHTILTAGLALLATGLVMYFSSRKKGRKTKSKS